MHGEVGGKLIKKANDELSHVVQVATISLSLEKAHTKPLTTERLTEQFGCLGNTPFKLEDLTNNLNHELMLPVSELNRMRREIIEQLELMRLFPKPWQFNQNATY